MGRYDDIINLEHHTSKRHPRMPLSERAAQFAPFAALTGYEEMIEKTGAEEEIPRQAWYNEARGYDEVKGNGEGDRFDGERN